MKKPANHFLQLMKGTSPLALILLALSLSHAANGQATFTDIGPAGSPPVPGPYDIYQTNTLNERGNSGTFNYFTDNTGQPGGTTFVTRSFPTGYVVTNVFVQCLSSNTGNNGTGSPTATQAYQISFYQISGTTDPSGLGSNATLITSITTAPGAVTTVGDWLSFGNLSVSLSPNTTNAFTWGRLSEGGGFMAIPLVTNNIGNGPSTSPGPFAGGRPCLISPAGGANSVTYGVGISVNGTPLTNTDTVFSMGIMPQFSTNIYGYSVVVCPPGTWYIANQFITTNNSIASLIRPDPGGSMNGDALEEFTGAGYTAPVRMNSADPPTYYTGPATTTILDPGTAAVFDNAHGTNLFLTFSGTVPQGVLTNSSVQGFNLISSIVPQEGAIDSVLGYPAANGDWVILYPTPSSTATVTYTNDTSSSPPWNGTGGSHTTPTLGVGQGFFYNNNSGSVEEWVRTFDVSTNGLPITNVSFSLSASQSNGLAVVQGATPLPNQKCQVFANGDVALPLPWNLAGTVTSDANGNFTCNIDTSARALFFYAEIYEPTALAVTWADPAAITYGTALSPTQLDAKANEQGTFDYTPPFGTVLRTGTNSLSVVFTPTDTTDYTNETNTVNLVVLPAPLTVTADDISRAYGETNPVFMGVISGLENGDDITATYTCTATTNSPATTYTIMPTLVDPDNLETNYTVNLVDGTLTVTGATPVISWAGPAPITYGAALTTNQLDAGANVPGNFVYAPMLGTVLRAGTNALSAVFTPTDTVDYTSTTNTVNLVVSPAVLTVTAGNAGRAYGQTNPVFTGIIAGLQNGDNITATYSCGATSNSPVTTYLIMPALVDLNDLETNYIVSLVDGTLTVSQAAPIVTWTNPPPITYGAALTTNELNAAANVSGSFVYNPTNSSVLYTGTNALSAVFTPSDAVDYVSATNTVNLVVLPATLTVTAADAARPYGQTNPVFAGMITGVQNGDDITASYSCSATTNSPVTTYSIMPALVDPSDLETNYIVGLVDGTLTVTQVTPVVTWASPAPITFGAPLTTNQLDATANVPGGFVYNPTNGAVLPAGTNALSVIFTPTDAVDYTSASNTVNLVVTELTSTSLFITFKAQVTGNAVVLNWNDPTSIFSLQSSQDLRAGFSNVASATSPYTNTAIGTQMFFRLKGN